MTIRTVSTLSMILVLGPATAMAAPPAQATTASKAATQGKMEMSHAPGKMATEPHHVLAMTYDKNLSAFATALHQQAARTTSLNLEFARVAIGEMRRNFDQMRAHHQEHMQGMSPEMHAKMSGKMTKMMDGMKTHEADMSTGISELEKEIASPIPDARKISHLAETVQKHLTEMAGMHGGC